MGSYTFSNYRAALFVTVGALVAACSGGGSGGGGGGGGGADGGDEGGGQSLSCTGLFGTKGAGANYVGNERVTGCYNPGVYSTTATVAPTDSGCYLMWQAAGGSPHSCPATLSGDASSGYDLHFCQGQNLEGAIHFPPDRSTFTGSYNYTVSCGSGTTYFESITRAP